MEHIIQQNMCCESSEKREHSSGQLFIRCSGSLALPQTAKIRQIALRDAQSGTARMRKNQHRFFRNPEEPFILIFLVLFDFPSPADQCCQPFQVHSDSCQVHPHPRLTFAANHARTPARSRSIGRTGLHRLSIRSPRSGLSRHRSPAT